MQPYVYIYEFDGVARYVGKGNNDRWKVHRRRKTKLSAKLKSIKNSTGKWVEPSQIIYCETEQAALLLEQKYISKFGREDLGTGTLWNLTNGGEGTKGYKVSEETKAKIRAAFKRADVKTKHSQATKRGMSDEDVKKRVKDAAIARANNTEWCEKHSATMKEHYKNLPEGYHSESRKQMYIKNPLLSKQISESLKAYNAAKKQNLQSTEV